jgi:hypothetical protein
MSGDAAKRARSDKEPAREATATAGRSAMEELLARVSEHLIGRIHGPLTLRLLLQPCVAIFFAVRAGMRDAREERPPYFWALFYDSAQRRAMLRDGWHDVGKVFVIAILLDVAYQVIVLRWIYPGETLIVAAALALVPYLLFRGTVTRIARMLRKPTAVQDVTRIER